MSEIVKNLMGKEVLAAIDSAGGDQTSKEEIRKKLDSFKESIS